MAWTSKEFWLDSQQAIEIFNFSKVSRPVQLPVKWVLWTVFLEVKWLDCETDGSPPATAEVNEWSCTSTPPYIFTEYTGTILFYQVLSSHV
jgi:hypothetical protein